MAETDRIALRDIADAADALGNGNAIIVLKRKREPKGEHVRVVPGLSGRFVGSEVQPAGWLRVIVDCRVSDIRAALARQVSP